MKDKSNITCFGYEKKGCHTLYFPERSQQEDTENTQESDTTNRTSNKDEDSTLLQIEYGK